MFASDLFISRLLYCVDMRKDVQDIFKMTPHDKQVMMFSATLSKDIRPVCKKFMQDVMSCSQSSSIFKVVLLRRFSLGDASFIKTLSILSCAILVTSSVLVLEALKKITRTF